MMVMTVVAMVVGSGSGGKCRTGKNNKKNGSAKLGHGENVARALHRLPFSKKIAASRQEMEAAQGARKRYSRA